VSPGPEWWPPRPERLPWAREPYFTRFWSVVSRRHGVVERSVRLAAVATTRGRAARVVRRRPVQREDSLGARIVDHLGRVPQPRRVHPDDSPPNDRPPRTPARPTNTLRLPIGTWCLTVRPGYRWTCESPMTRSWYEPPCRAMLLIVPLGDPLRAPRGAVITC
jgi:hypothetical protein